MRHGESFSEAEISWSAWEALPVSARVSDRLGDILVIAGELQSELKKDDARTLTWIAPEIDAVIVQIDAVLQRIAP